MTGHGRDEQRTLDAEASPDLATATPPRPFAGPDEPNGWWVGPSDDPDRFELLGTGLAGGEGVTFKARYHGAGTSLVVAVKQLRPPRSAPAHWPRHDDWQRWRDQVQILQQVSSPHLVQVRDVVSGPPPHPRHAVTVQEGVVHATPYVVMQWVEGQTLAERLGGADPGGGDRGGAGQSGDRGGAGQSGDRGGAGQSGDRGGAGPGVGQVPLQQRVAWVSHLAEALTAIHSVTRTGGNPLVHRDLKPLNCIVSSHTGDLVVIDIGTMRPAEDAVDLRGLHSLHYTAPEVLTDLTGPRAPSSDLYALGCVAYFCLTGEDPPVMTVDSPPLSVRDLRRRLRVPRWLRGRVARHLLHLLTADVATRSSVHPGRWAAELVAMCRPWRRWPWLAGTALLAAGVALAATRPWQPSTPDITLLDLSVLRPFGTSYQAYPFELSGSTLSITPPRAYDALWGGYLAADTCAADVEFDVRMIPDATSEANGYGVAVMPRGALADDQPAGASVQWEWTPESTIGAAGTYVRPAQLPGGAWSVKVAPTPAPDLSRTHHVRVLAVGTALTVEIDGARAARYSVPVACGGVGWRVWGARAVLSDIQVHAS